MCLANIMRTAQKGSRRSANIAETSRPSPVRANPRPPSRQSPRLGAAPANQIAAAQLVHPAHAYRVTSQSCLILHDRMSAFAVGCVRRQWHTGPQGAAQAVTPRRAADVDRTSRDDRPSVGDFFGDGHTDLVMQNTDGSVVLWDMSGSHIINAGVVGNPGASWNVLDDIGITAKHAVEAYPATRSSFPTTKM
jgi:hypothetical protein